MAHIDKLNENMIEIKKIAEHKHIDIRGTIYYGYCVTCSCRKTCLATTVFMDLCFDCIKMLFEKYDKKGFKNHDPKGLNKQFTFEQLLTDTKLQEGEEPDFT